MGNPGCTENGIKTGCLSNGVLDLSCTAVTIDFGSDHGVCGEALHQPPEKLDRECSLDRGEVVVSDGTTTVTPLMEDGKVQTLYFPCSESLCPFIVDGLGIDVEDIDGGTADYVDLSVELYTAAIGQSDGTRIEFPPGAIRVAVSGNVVDGMGTTPFYALTANTVGAEGTYEDDILTLDPLIFEAGGFTFEASLQTLECVEI